MDLGIRGKRAAVAAASDGLGLGVARALAEEGAQVVICGRRDDKVQAAAAEIGATGIVADVSTAVGGVEFVNAARDALGGIDILVANAGGPPPGDFASVTVDQYATAFELNCQSAIAMCYEAVPAMRAQKWGRVLAITSIAVRQPIPNLILSNTSRAALTGFLKTLAREVARDGVTVNSLLPGLHATQRLIGLYGRDNLDGVADGIPAGVLGDGRDNLDGVADGIPAGVLGDPGDFGRVGAFLCSEPAKFVTGTATPVDGGAYAALL